ncbi:gamma-glutamylcyclotransferase [Synechocystis sp. PCC 7339]|uniref:gamma-glutamylcyclotransferase family protein n=1 Tax=unclassified Synechocystis TaxID=2640012 RepID=UPI001BAE6092|nr:MULTISPECIES: gamma-glutamylcyclotransferase [unclassified Synechocystis]QUS60109.1 gamma-glutamylcyclotransferase [Synechocystis sp. PCC 7338]UAJ72443.1 gamma-glutamylcyclotransferase [Synechocystis sp. PCC 7339]
MASPNLLPVDMKIKVFVYGTLMPGECNHQAYCHQQIEPPALGYVLGQIYHLANFGYPALAIGEDRVWGYCLTFPAGFSLEYLDSLEDYHPGRSPRENVYDRCWAKVFGPQDQVMTEAWLYRMDLGKIEQYGGVYLPNGRWSGQQKFIA